MSSGLRPEELRAEDAAANAALSQRVGWKDTLGEWHTLHAAARVLGVRVQGELVAQGALGDYGTAATLAKMVVAPEFQHQGLGRVLLEELLAPARARGIPVGLCATDQGRPLYEKAGFSVSGELMILFGTPRAAQREPGSVVPLLDADVAIELERRFVGCDRSRMLRARLGQASAAFSATGGELGFVMASAFDAGTLVGPVLAQTDATARRLLEAVFARLPGPIRIDVPLQQAALREWLVSLGLREHTLRVEMVSGGERAPWQVPERFALATQAWG
jgi:GNAT superfamily N-acetyltransferase